MVELYRRRIACKNPALKGNVKAGDGGAKFRAEWPEVDLENREVDEEE